MGRDREIHLNGKVAPKIKIKNVVSNHKYNAITFLHIALYHQFKAFFSLCYLLICCTQAINVLKVGKKIKKNIILNNFIIGFLFSYVSPLAFVVILSLIKEGVEDVKRRIKDK